jgi:hypothetical protein
MARLGASSTFLWQRGGMKFFLRHRLKIKKVHKFTETFKDRNIATFPKTHFFHFPAAICELLVIPFNHLNSIHCIMRSTFYQLIFSVSLLGFLFVSQNSTAQYCVNNLYSPGCIYNDYINDLSVGTISQTATGCGSNGYSDYTSLVANMEQGSTGTLSLTVGNYGHYVSMWIDADDDEEFEANEKLVSYLYCNTPNITYSANFYIDPFTPLGEHRMRVRSVQYNFPIDPCSFYSYGEVHDYTVNITAPGDMVYFSSTATQTFTDAISLGSTDAQIIGMQVVTTGSLNPVKATSFTVNSNGSTNFSGDVSEVKIYYTGSSSTFSTGTLFGSTTNLSNPITGSQELVGGANYFWVTYDVKQTGTIGNYLDAEFTSVTVSGSSYTPTVTAPAGSRQIGYCTPSNTFGCFFAYIDGVELNTLSNTFSYCSGAPFGYYFYEGITTELQQGSSYSIKLTGPSFEPVGFGVWIDFNNDGDFSDDDEFVFSSATYATGVQTGNVAVPTEAALGEHRMRVRCKDYGTVSSGESCSTFSYGEAEDYTITITEATPMEFVSSTVTQNNTAFVETGDADQEIIAIEVTTQGALDPFNLTSLTINANGSTNYATDVSGLKVYYTGTSGTFATTTLFGSAASPGVITGNQTLSSGTNYFWVTYDVKSTATISNQLDAECTAIAMTGNGGNQTPDITAPFGSRQIDYCPASTTYGCQWGYIDAVQFNTLSNTFSNCNFNSDGYIQYDASQYTTTLEAGSSYIISLTGGPTYEYVGFGVWIDFNNDGDFEDNDEFCFSSPQAISGTQTGTIDIPATATIGEHRMRVRSKDYWILFESESCGELLYYYGETEDYTVTITAPSSMVYVSSTTIQPDVTPVSAGSMDQQIIGVQVVTQGSLNPFNLTSLQLNSNGSTDFSSDVTGAKVYYTGASPTFAATNLFGSATDLSNPITGSQVLEGGNNYFWVAYDLSAEATIGNFLDAECEEIVMSGNGGTQTPDESAPVGSREINYCVPVFQYGCYFAYIDGVVFNTLSNTFSYCNGNLNGYYQYPQSGNTTTEVELGQSYDLTLTGPLFEPVGFGVWIDYNNDGDFTDLEEFVYSSPFYSYGTQYASITLACNTDYIGDHRMRIRAFDYYAPNSGDACTQYFYGETEDYIITLAPPLSSQTYEGSTTSQDNQEATGTGTNDVEIMAVQVTVGGCSDPLTATSFTINSNGSTNFAGDVTNVKVYYTGTSSVFSPINLFGSATNLSSPITGSQELNAGTNYFWVAYDVSANATLGNYLDAECTQIVLTGQGNVTPSITAPFGNRQINYCEPASNYGCYWGYIDNVQLNTLSNSFSNCNGNFDGYIQYDASQFTTTLQMGAAYEASVTGGPSYDNVGFAVWIDYNNDNDFDDPTDFVWASSSALPGVQNFTVTVPFDPSYAGERRMRIRSKEYSTIGSGEACTYFLYYYGETEDYTITIEAPPACTTTPTAGTVSADPAVVCASGTDVTLSLNGYSLASDLSFQWQSSPNGSTYTNIAGATNTVYETSVTGDKYYRVKVTCDNTGQNATSDGFLMKLGGDEEITAYSGATICGEGTVTISAAGNADHILWYDSESAVTPLFYSSSPSNFSPYVNQTTTYYAAAANGTVNSGSVGALDNTIGTTYQYYQAFQFFNVYKPLTISGVYVYPTSAGDVIVQLQDLNYIPLETVTVAVTEDQVNQKTWIPLNIKVDPGIDYHLAYGYGGVNLNSNDYNFSGYAYPYQIDEVLSITRSAYGIQYYMHFYDWVVDYSELCVSPKTPVTVTTTVSAEITVTPDPSSSTICAGSGEAVDLSVSGGSYNTFAWSPADGLSSTTGSAVSATPDVTTVYTVLASNGNCANADTFTVYVSNPPAVTATADPDAVCSGGASQLLVSAPATDYSVYEIDFDPESSNTGTIVPLSDESYSGALDIGFNFNFYGINYTKFYIASNLWISFTQPFFAGCCQGQTLADPNSPNNLIAVAWEDYNPGLGGTVRYWTSGQAPFRKLVVEFKEIQHYYSGNPVTVQAILYETTNIIEIHSTTMNGDPSPNYWAPHTMGIENSTGTEGLAVPGRNGDATWTATNDAWRFAPPQLQYSWTPSGTLDNATAVNPMATPSSTTTYTVTVTDEATLCATEATVTVNVVTTPVGGTVSPSDIEFCGQGSAALLALDYTPGATLQWQESSTPGGPYTNIPGATSDEYTTPVINDSKYYVVKATCTGSATSAEGSVTVNEAPDSPVAIDGGNCGPGEVILGAVSSGQGQLNWYYDANGNNFLGSGTPFTTPFINETTTFYVSQGDIAATPLTTTLNGFYSSSGNMFDIQALNDVFITGFDITMNTFYTSDIEVYYKPGSYLGSEYLPGNWILVGTASDIQGGGLGVAVPLNLSLFVHIAAGTSGAFYITCNNYYSYLSNQYGTSAGNVYVQDENIQVKEGISNYYPFGYAFGPYAFGGKVRYTAPGCSSPLVPVTAEIYLPQVEATVSASPICAGETITLIAENLGSGNFTYEWMPQLVGMVPQNGLDDTVTVSPEVTMTFTVSITDPLAPLCDTMIMIPIVVNPSPGIFISNLDPQYYENEPAVTLEGIPAGGTFSGPGITGNQFNPSSLPIGGPYTITYSYTDVNGCSASYSQDTYVVPIEGITEVGEIDRSISFYPNPSEGMFTMQVTIPSAAQSVLLTVHDVVGRKLFTHDYGSAQGQLQTHFDFSKWAKGSYYATLNVDGTQFRRKVVIQ